MATKRKNTREHVSVELPPGIRPVPRKKGVGFQVTIGSGSGRCQPIFDTLELATDFKEAADNALRQGIRFTKEAFVGSQTPTEAIHSEWHQASDVLDVLGEKVMAKYKRPEEYKFQLGVLRRFLRSKGFLKRDLRDVTRIAALELPTWLNAENYDRGTQSQIISAAKKLWGEAVLCGWVANNPFAELSPSSGSLPDRDRRGRDRTVEEAPAWTASQLVAIAQALRSVYRLAFWLLVVLGDRRSEVMGFRLKDWDPSTRTLSVLRQRTASPRKGTSEPKTKSSKRPLMVPPLLAQAIDDYIAATHGAPPESPEDSAEWSERYLLQGVYGGPMDSQSLCKNVKAACSSIGLIPEVVGKFKPLHHLRATLSALLQDRISGLSGKAVSIWLGHKTATPMGDEPASSVTRRHYSPKVPAQLQQVSNYIEDWLVGEIVPLLGSSDLLAAPSPFEDGITIEEAVRRLSCVGEGVDGSMVLELIQGGDLRCVRVRPDGGEGLFVMVSEADVDALLGDLIRVASDSYSTADVAVKLMTDHRGIYRLGAQGLIFEQTNNARARRARHGHRGGMLPGGGRRWGKAEVDQLERNWAVLLERRRTWLTMNEAAMILRRSTDTIRRMADRGELELWRDEVSSRRERRVSPYSVRQAQLKLEISITEAAQLLGWPVGRIKALTKMGELASGSRFGTVVLGSVERLRMLADANGDAA
jgi:integrase